MTGQLMNPRCRGQSAASLIGAGEDCHAFEVRVSTRSTNQSLPRQLFRLKSITCSASPGFCSVVTSNVLVVR
jgi:hypothetical protein